MKLFLISPDAFVQPIEYHPSEFAAGAEQLAKHLLGWPVAVRPEAS